MPSQPGAPDRFVPSADPNQPTEPVRSEAALPAGALRQPGALLLAGSGEFRPAMVAADRELLKHTPGSPPKVAILPTAAGQEVTVGSWIRDGVQQFTALGCEAYGVRAVNRAEMGNPAHITALKAADLVYMSGGNPGYLVETLRWSAVWEAIVTEWRAGSALAGSSAGAMAMGEYTLVRREGQVGRMPAHWEPGLGLLPGIGVIPHYDRFGPERTMPRVEDAPDGLVVLGIDEDTVILNAGGSARVLGRGTVTVWLNRQPTLLASGDIVPPGLIPLP